MSKTKRKPRGKRVGFYVQLPAHTVRSIRRMSKASKLPQWAVVSGAISTVQNDFITTAKALK